MKSYLIKDTTKEERIALIREWIPADEIMDGSEGKGINPTALQQRLRRMIPDFSVRKLGYRRFTDFLAALEAADASPETGDGGQVNPDP